MSSILRVLRGAGLQSSRLKSRPSPLSRNFFISRPSTSNIGLGRSQHFSSGGYGYSNYEANMRILYGLLGANLAVFGYAQYSKTLAQQGFPEKWLTFYRNMTLNLSEVQNRPWTLITSTFTHINFWHLLGNAVTTYFLGQFLAAAPMMNPARILLITFGSGLAGSIGWLANRTSRSAPRQYDRQRAMGFSGSVMGIMTVAACFNPTSKVLIYGIVPVPLWGLVAGYFVYDGYYLNSNNTQIAHAGHLGGLMFGFAYYFLKLRGLRF